MVSRVWAGRGGGKKGRKDKDRGSRGAGGDQEKLPVFYSTVKTMAGNS